MLAVNVLFGGGGLWRVVGCQKVAELRGLGGGLGCHGLTIDGNRIGRQRLAMCRVIDVGEGNRLL